MTQKKQTTTPNTPPSRRRPDSGDIALFGAITLLGAALDLWSKHAVFNWLTNAATPEYSIIDGVLRFILAENTGAAFSLFAGMKWVFISIAVIALVVIQTLFWVGRLTPRLMLIAVSCINAGVIGNLYDRFFNEGRVRDFIDVYVGIYHWPTFNVADSLLCIGVGILLLLSFTTPAEK
jgi:signal peptidase II